jgi:hypothetical protein
MSHRLLWSCATLTAVIVVASLTAVPAAQTQTAGAAAVTGTATPPRTPWGDPDLQGIWTGSTLPSELGKPTNGRGFGMYKDRFVKTADGWRFKYRLFVLAGTDVDGDNSPVPSSE